MRISKRYGHYLDLCLFPSRDGLSEMWSKVHISWEEAWSEYLDRKLYIDRSLAHNVRFVNAVA